MEGLERGSMKFEEIITGLLEGKSYTCEDSYKIFLTPQLDTEVLRIYDFQSYKISNYTLTREDLWRNGWRET
jgi:hypothetical protein